MSIKEVLKNGPKRIKCPKEWKCKRLNKIIKVTGNVPSGKGWICDCGDWINNDDILHDVILWGFGYNFRDIVDLNKKVSFSYYGFKSNIKPICCDCGKDTDREINGVYVCKDCYEYEPCYGSKYFYDDTIRNCYFFNGIDTDFSLLICKECDRIGYCKKLVKKEVK